VPNPELAVEASGALLIFGGASILLCVKPRLGAAAIVIFLASASPVMHDERGGGASGLLERNFDFGVAAGRGRKLKNCHNLFPLQVEPLRDLIDSRPGLEVFKHNRNGHPHVLKTHAPLTFPGTLSTSIVAIAATPVKWRLHDVLPSLETGAVLLTATRRLARLYRQDFISWQRDRGRTFWKSPLILPLDAYVHRLWNEVLAAAPPDLTVLTADQEAIVWQQIIRDSPEGASLLQVEATARRAMEAWTLIHSYRLPMDGRYQATEDCEAFLNWAREFERRCAKQRWLDSARLPGFILELELSLPTIFFTGFDELSPLQSDLLQKFAAREVQPARIHSIARTKVCPTAEDEIRGAAAWARDALEQDPAARVGIVVLNLTQVRAKIDRIFRDELQSSEAFHISLGQTLDRYPIIHAALEIIRLSTIPGHMPLTRSGMLLRSPYLAGATGERAARASLDTRLRRHCGWEITLDELRQHSYSDTPVLNRSLKSLYDILAEIDGPLDHHEWSRAFAAILRAVGWPGDRTPDSREHQLLERWPDLLSQFASIDAVSGPTSFTQAADRLHALASSTVFQFEDTGAPIQISDASEMAGVRCDRQWVMGLHDEAMPAPADPNPFLPISLQWAHAVPHASAERQYKSSRIVFDRLLSSASEVVLSFPQTEGDRTLSPSPFLTATPQPVSARPSAWIAKIREASRLEAFIDETAPPHLQEGVQRGGARVLKDMAACPFRAFAAHRLGANEMDGIEPGLSQADKGMALHQVLQLVWGELKSHAALCALSPDDLTGLLRRHINSVLDPLGNTTNVKVERIRIEGLLKEWMKLERSRPAFNVVRLEEKKPVEIGGLHLDVRADRVDELPDGRQVILDYKTGEVKSRGWSGERLDEPQLPLYCVSSEAPIAGSVFARIQAKGYGFTGIAETPLPDFKEYTSALPVSRQLEEWRAALTGLAVRFRSGDARVDPKYGHKTCEYCALTPLCRVQDRE
jgi:probable DNA repair protein